MRPPAKPLRIALLALSGFAIIFVTVGIAGWGDPASNEQAIGEISRWCERVSGGLLREPINTLGNLGFVIAGLAMLRTLDKDRSADRPIQNRFIGHQPVVLLYAAATIFLGPGSMAMHGTHTRFGAWLDNTSMVAYILIPWLLNLSILGGWRRRTFFAAYSTLLTSYALAYWFAGSDLGIGLDLFGVSIALWIISEVLYRVGSVGPIGHALSGLIGFGVALAFRITPGDVLASPGEFWWVVLFWVPALVARHPSQGRRTYTPWFWAGIVAFFGAYAIWLTGTESHPWCNPDGILQAHAIWHLLTAVATWSFFKFLRTERPDPLDLPAEVDHTQVHDV